MPSPEPQSPTSWTWKPCSTAGLRPVTTACTRTLSPICVNVAVPLAVLPLVGCSLATAWGPSGRNIWQPASSAAAETRTRAPRIETATLLLLRRRLGGNGLGRVHGDALVLLVVGDRLVLGLRVQLRFLRLRRGGLVRLGGLLRI